MKKMKWKKLVNSWVNKWKVMLTIPCGGCERWCEWGRWGSGLDIKEGKWVPPGDVPKGHMVVYVGEKHKRFVIKMKLLKHPLFQALLDEAENEYAFFSTPSDSKLRIPCHENVFLHVLRCARSSPLHPSNCASS